MRLFAALLFLVLLAAGLQACGQKGALTRPEPANFVAASNK